MSEAQSKVRRAFVLAGNIVAIPPLAFVHLLTALGIRYAAWPSGDVPRTILAVVYGIGIVFAVIRWRPRWRTVALTLVFPLLVWALYGMIEPKRDARYPPETSRMARVERSGDHVILRDVRDFEYRTELDFDPRWVDREFDLSDVRTLDYVVCWWTEGRQIAHTMMSFGFSDGRYLCCSIEIRREAGEIYGPIEGLYRRYELIYVWGNERDLIRLRTNYRGEEVHLYRTTCTPEESRALLEDYLAETARLASEPAFYNTFSRNCTSSIRDHINAVLDRKIPWYARRLRNGWTDERAFAGGWIEGGPDFAALQRSARINERALAADSDPDFSQRIRTHLQPTSR